MNFLRPAVIIGSLPVTLQNGTTADATQVMSDLNWIVNQVNANAAPLATTALTNANNNFTVVQSGIAASAPANFPIASQIQNDVFRTFQSTLGTNTINARCAALPLTAWPTDAVFTFFPSQTNTGPANITVDSAGSSIIFSMGSTLVGGELKAGIPALIKREANRLDLFNNAGFGDYVFNALGANVNLTQNVVTDGPSVAPGAGKVFLAFGSINYQDTAGTSNWSFKLWDGVTTVDSKNVTISQSQPNPVFLMGIFVNPAGNIKISAADNSSNSGSFLFNASGNGRDCNITVIRIR